MTKDIFFEVGDTCYGFKPGSVSQPYIVANGGANYCHPDRDKQVFEPGQNELVKFVNRSFASGLKRRDQDVFERDLDFETLFSRDPHYFDEKGLLFASDPTDQGADHAYELTSEIWAARKSALNFGCVIVREPRKAASDSRRQYASFLALARIDEGDGGTGRDVFMYGYVDDYKLSAAEFERMNSAERAQHLRIRYVNVSENFADIGWEQPLAEVYRKEFANGCGGGRYRSALLGPSEESAPIMAALPDPMTP
ncbi:MAG: hypothetical protein R3C13_07890 [Hyphomonas sp.]|uniref:hypothetical protein n=1 Tax=Hyphomonas sp. TaxID=87 RepID=UPI00352909DF